MLLLHNDAIEFVDTLAEWGAQNGGGPDGDHVVVPGVEPGAYSLCSVPATEVAALWTAGPTQAACVSASLAQGAVLLLSQLHGREGP